MPECLAIGLSYETFMHLTPNKISSFYKAYKLKRKMRDEEMWMQGQYIYEAISVALSHFSASMVGKKSQAKYREKPFMYDIDDKPKTQEELDNIEIQNMIFAEEQWIKNFESKGLPKTIIKKKKQE